MRCAVDGAMKGHLFCSHLHKNQESVFPFFVPERHLIIARQLIAGKGTAAARVPLGAAEALILLSFSRPLRDWNDSIPFPQR